MKSPRLFAAASHTLLLGVWLLASSGCDKPEPPMADPSGPPIKSEPAKTAPAKAPAVSAEKNSFNEVTAHLDSGGNLYLYLSTEQLLDGLSKAVSDWRQFALAMPDTGVDAAKAEGGNENS